MTTRKPKTELRQALNELAPYFRRCALLSVFTSLLVLSSNGHMLEVYDRVVTTRNTTTLLMLTIIVLFALTIMEVLTWARSKLMYKAGRVLDSRLVDRVFNAIFSANLQRVPGGTVQVMGDFRTIRDFLSSPIVPAIMEAPVALTFMIFIFATSPVLGWFAAGGAIIQTLIGWLNERATLEPLIAANRASAAAQIYADNTLRNVEVIESMGMLRNVYRRWIARQHEFLKLQAFASGKAGYYRSLAKLWQHLISTGLLGLGCWLLLNDQLNGGASMMIISWMLGGRVLAPLVMVVTQWRLVVNVRDAWGRLDTLLQTLPTPPDTMKLPTPIGNLQADGAVAAAPNSNLPIVRNVSFSLAPGEMLAVVGPSASGKTTLARLLVGIWPSLGGKIRLDGADIYSWNKQELGPHVGYLPQGVELFDGSVAENIARFGEVEIDEVQDAARLVGLHEFILTLPQGYNTQIGAEGARLSGGQRQRVALARALYRNPVYVVLDEPNSSLDDIGDAALASAISQLKATGTTFVAMTHRISLLAVADKMLVLQDGSQRMFGPRDPVLAELRKQAQPLQTANTSQGPLNKAEAEALNAEKARAEARAKARADARAKARAEARAKARAEARAKARDEARVKARTEAQKAE